VADHWEKVRALEARFEELSTRIDLSYSRNPYRDGHDTERKALYAEQAKLQPEYHDAKRAAEQADRDEMFPNGLPAHP
jgi:hypothetical protein